MKILAEQPEEKLEESYGTYRDITITTTTRLYTWAPLEVRDEFIVIGVRINICMDPYTIKLRFILGGLLYCDSSFWIIIMRLLCLTSQLISWCELVDKIECSWCFHVFYLWFWFLWFSYDYVKLLEEFNHMNITY